MFVLYFVLLIVLFVAVGRLLNRRGGSHVIYRARSARMNYRYHGDTRLSPDVVDNPRQVDDVDPAPKNFD